MFDPRALHTPHPTDQHEYNYRTSSAAHDDAGGSFRSVWLRSENASPRHLPDQPSNLPSLTPVHAPAHRAPARLCRPTRSRCGPRRTLAPARH
jgi:hypothetical protein